MTLIIIMIIMIIMKVMIITLESITRTFQNI